MKPSGKMKWVAMAALAILIAAAAVYLYEAGSQKPEAGSLKPEAGSQISLYLCPMHPSYTADRPGKCPICGMDLVPAKKEEAPHAMHGEAAEGRAVEGRAVEGRAVEGRAVEGRAVEGRAAVAIDGEKQLKIGVKTAGVTRGQAATEIRASARVAFDPALAVAQREFIEARRTGDRSLAEAARRRLIIMGLGEDQIAGLARSGKADENLVLPGKGAWIYAAIYENELAHVKVGQEAAIEAPDGGNLGTGIVRAIGPILDPATRTANARIELKGAAASLSPNMFVTAILRADLGEKLLVPKSAVIASGTRRLVFLVHGGEHFIPREVSLGAELKDHYVVEGGLEAGDVVAISALFLIDSESQLKAAAGAMGGHH